MTADPGGAAMALPRGRYGDADSLFRTTGRRLFRAAFRALGDEDDAREAVQDTCVKLLRNWRRVGDLETAEEQCAYLFKILANEVRQTKRRAYRHHEQPGIDGEDSTRVAGHLDENGQEAAEHLQLVWKVIDGLPRGRREVMIWYAAGYEYQEIASMLGLDVSTVRSHISNARKQLPPWGAGRPKGGI